MIKVRPTVTLELETSAQKITVDLQEAKEIIKSLSKFVNGTSSDIKTSDERAGKEKGKRKTTKAATATRKGAKRGRRPSLKTKSAQKNVPSMSDNKRQEIIDHINKQLSARPKTLSALLKGISYVPNYLPAIRQMVESRGNISREVIGKRTYYSRKGSSQQQQNSKQSKLGAIGA